MILSAFWPFIAWMESTTYLGSRSRYAARMGVSSRTRLLWSLECFSICDRLWELHTLFFSSRNGQYLTVHNILYCNVLSEDSCPASGTRYSVPPRCTVYSTVHAHRLSKKVIPQCDFLPLDTNKIGVKYSTVRAKNE